MRLVKVLVLCLLGCGGTGLIDGGVDGTDAGPRGFDAGPAPTDGGLLCYLNQGLDKTSVQRGEQVPRR